MAERVKYHAKGECRQRGERKAGENDDVVGSHRSCQRGQPTAGNIGNWLCVEVACVLLESLHRGERVVMPSNDPLTEELGRRRVQNRRRDDDSEDQRDGDCAEQCANPIVWLF